jgi:hypothetical protein
VALPEGTICRSRTTRGRHVVTQGDLVGQIECLEIRCTRCLRHGRVMLDKLLREHGPDLPMPELAVRLAAACPKTNTTDPTDRCFVIFPQLVKLATIPRPTAR